MRDAQAQAVYERLKMRLKARLADLLDPVRAGVNTRQADRDALKTGMHDALQLLLEESRGVSFDPRDQSQLIEEVLTDVLGFGPLDDLLADETISEIMINGPQEIFVERSGHLQRVEATFRDTHHLLSVIERMLGSVNLSVNESDPLCDARLADGSRINVIIPPLVLNGPVVTIRRKLREWTMDDYVAMGALSREIAQFLDACVHAKVNMVLSGGTSTGKTTLVSILSTYIPSDERIITIENVSELDLPGQRHWIRLVGKPANLEGRGEIPLRVLVKNALRMRPDRIVLGEARGGEALDVVQAMHSGHDGFMTVLHANSPASALERLQTLMLMSGLDVPPSACRTQIANSVDLVVHMSRFIDGSRRIASVTQVTGTSADGFELEDLFVFAVEHFSENGQLHGAFRYTGAAPRFLQKFQRNNVSLPAWIRTNHGQDVSTTAQPGV